MPLDIEELFGPQRKRSTMRVALLLRALADLIGEPDSEDEDSEDELGAFFDPRETLREPSIRVRPDFIPYA